MAHAMRSWCRQQRPRALAALALLRASRVEGSTPLDASQLAAIVGTDAGGAEGLDAALSRLPSGA